MTHEITASMYGAERETSRYEEVIIPFDDPYAIDPTRQGQISEQLQVVTEEGENYLMSDGKELGKERKRTANVDDKNVGLQMLRNTLPGFDDWHQSIPRAAALNPLYDPSIARAEGNHELADWFTYIEDGKGLRWRAFAVNEILFRNAKEHSDSRLSWLSLGAGAGRPIMDSMRRIGDEGYAIPESTLVDLDSGALKDASEYAETHGIEGQVTTKRFNILRPNTLSLENPIEPLSLGVRALTALSAKKEDVLPEYRYDVVEAVGLLEYLKAVNWPYTYNKVIRTKMEMSGAVALLRDAYERVDDDGLLLVGNMLDSHPELGFTLNVIQWPHIQPRSVEEMMDIFDEAGLDGKRTVYKSESEGAYALYGVRKPSGSS